jgi:type I restriction enzyme S subunit
MSNKVVQFIEFGKIAEFRNGLNFSKDNHGTGCCLIGVSDFQNNFTPDYDSLEEVNPEGITKDDDYLRKDDILFVRSNGNKTLVGRSLYIDQDVNALFSGFCIRARLVNDLIDPLFLAYYTRTNHFKSSISFIAGTNINNLNQDILSNVKLPLYPKGIQFSITNVLSIIDEKIQLNNRINAELEAMAKTLYDYWFVQFDFPDQHGKPYKSSGGKMVWNEKLKREIPDGWEVESIEKSCQIIDCLHSKKPDTEFENDDYYLLQLENILDNGLLDLSNKYFVSKKVYQTWTSRIEVKEDDIVITNAGRVAATAQIPQGIQAGIGRNITAIRPISINPTYLFLSFRGLDMKRQIKWNTDSGAFFTSLNVKGIKKLFIVRPPDTLENAFENIVHSIRRKREITVVENQRLAELRDWLLPMLMNGQVKVNERETGRA